MVQLAPGLRRGLRSVARFASCTGAAMRKRDGEDWDWYYKVVSWAWPEVAKKLKEFLERG